MSKIFLRVFAGLGNQQFQYAFAKALAIKFNKYLVLDKSYFLKRYHPIKEQGFIYPYKLDQFNIAETYTNGIIQEFIGILTKRPKIRRLYQIFVNANPLLSFMPVLVDQKNFSEKIILDNRNVILCDYFQKSEIFEEYDHQIKAMFNLGANLKKINQSYLDVIKKSKCSVSIHIRRKDYVEKDHVRKNFASIEISYYTEALKTIDLNEKIDLLVVFSDDQEWVKKNMFFQANVLYVEGDGPDYEHQYLMSQCKHNIISNSTFSWWAAWLNPNFQKIVCVPSRWFEKSERANDIYIPLGWIRVANSP